MITLHIAEQNITFSDQELIDYAEVFELNRFAPRRFSDLFVANLIVLDRFDGVSHFGILDEIKNLEGLDVKSFTKPATIFTGPHLRGFWHKHFVPNLPSVMAHNIENHLKGGKLEKIIHEVMHQDKSPVVTKQMLDEFAERVVIGSFESRADKSKLTGEWIVFAKHEGKNYYLCISKHNVSNEDLAANIKNGCLRKFPFLSTYFES